MRAWILFITVVALVLDSRTVARAAHADCETAMAELKALLERDAQSADASFASLFLPGLFTERLPATAAETLRTLRLGVAKLEAVVVDDDVRTKCRSLLLLLREEERRLSSQSEAALAGELLSILQQSLAAADAREVNRLREKLQPRERPISRANPPSMSLARLQRSSEDLSKTLTQLAEILSQSPAEQRRSRVQALFNEPDFTALLPRSDLLDLVDRSYPLPAPDPKRQLTIDSLELRIRNKVAEAADLANLPRVVSEIQQLTRPDRPGGQNGFQVSGAYAQLQSSLSMYLQVYTDFQAGKQARLVLTNPTRSPFERIPGPYDPRGVIAREELLDIETSLLRIILPRALQLPKEEILRPEETPLTFLPRALKEAVGREDWEAVLRILKHSSRWNFWGAVKTVDDVGLHRFLLALQQKDEGKLEEAVYSYLFALQSGCNLLPAERIGRDLRVLRKIDPDKYEAGVSRAVKSIFIQSLIYRYKSYGFASFLTPIDEQHEVAPPTQGIARIFLEVPAAH